MNHRNIERNWAFWVVMALAFYYQIYRYPLEYGIEPPYIWRVGKYVLCTCAALLAMPRSYRTCDFSSSFDWIFPLVFLITSFLGVHQSDKFLLQVGFSGLVAFFIVQSINGKIPYEDILKFIVISFVINVIFVFVQICGLVFFNKKFVWATNSVLTSRFGGLLVEPLGAAYLSFIFIGLTFEFLGIKRWLMLTLASLCLFMTHTLTGVFFLILAGCATATFLLYGKRGRLAAFLFQFFCVAVIVVCFYTIWMLQDTGTYFTAKWLSIRTHLSYWWPARWSWFPEQESLFSESWWSFAIQNMGILLFLVYAWVLFILFWSCAKQARKLLMPRADGSFRGVFVGIYLSGLYAIFGSINQLYPAMYPVGLLSILFALMIKYDKISEEISSKKS